jgi:hypothetical protein
MTYSHRVALAATTLLFSTLGAALGEIQVSFPWERSWPVVTPKTAKDFRILVHNETQKLVDLRVTAILKGSSGVETRVEGSAALKPGAKGSVPCPLDKQRKGAWELSYRISNAGDKKPLKERTVRFGYMDPPGPSRVRHEFMFGIVSHSERLPSQEMHRELEAAAFAGCKVLRAGPEWDNIQPAPDKWKWEVMDDMVATGERLGMEFNALLAYCPKWAAPAERRGSADWLDWSRAAPELNAWRSFVKSYAERYKGRIRLWEPWNEPDLDGFWRGTTDEYIALVEAAAEEVRTVDPGNLIMSGGFATLREHGGRNRNPDLQVQTMRKLGPSLNFHAIHEHGPFPQLVQVVDGDYAALRKTLPPPVPPLYFNETAMPSVGRTERQQAWGLIKKATFARSRGAAGYLWYDLRNDGTSPTDAEHHFGLLTHEMEPKPSYIAFSTFARLAVPRPFLAQLAMAKDRWFFIHGDDRAKLLIFWNDDPGSQNEQIMLRMPGVTRAQLIDVDGNASPLQTVNEMGVVAANKEPLFLVADGAKSIENGGRLAGAARTFFGGPGEEVAVSCEFMNPVANPVSVEVEWHPEKGIDLVNKPALQTIALPPGGKGISTALVRLPGGEDYRQGATGNIRIFYRFIGAPYKGRIILPVHYGTIAVGSGGFARNPDFVLNREDQLFSFIEADPHFVEDRWSGPNDLSVKGWFDVTASDLVLKVEVTEDRHFQGETSFNIWRGDSVQCALNVPGKDGTWEFGFAEGLSGQTETAVWNKPAGSQDLKIKVQIEARGEGRIYTAFLPRGEMGLTDEVLKQGFRFNIAVNDNDGKVRAHALQLAPGIVENKRMDASPYVTFNAAPKQ